MVIMRVFLLHSVCVGQNPHFSYGPPNESAVDSVDGASSSSGQFQLASRTEVQQSCLQKQGRMRMGLCRIPKAQSKTPYILENGLDAPFVDFTSSSPFRFFFSTLLVLF